MSSDDMHTTALALLAALLLLVAGALLVVLVACLWDAQAASPARFKQVATLWGANAALFAVCTILALASMPVMACLCAGAGVMMIKRAGPHDGHRKGSKTAVAP